MIINKNTFTASAIHWASKKIERVVHSSAAAETIAMQKMFSTIFFVRKVLEEMCGQRVKNLQCVALTDNQGLFSNIHHLKSNVDDFRLHSDILELRQSIEQEKTVQEVRYVHSLLNIADALTKTTKTGVILLQLVQTGQYDLPGGTFVRDSTMSSVRTWNELMRVEQQEERSQDQWTPAQGVVTPVGRSNASISVPTASSTIANARRRSQEEVDKTDQRVFFTSVQTQSPINKLPRWTSSSSPAPFLSSQSSLPGSYSATKSLGTGSTSTPTTGTPSTRRQQETRTTSRAKARPDGNIKPLQSGFMSRCQNITKISEKSNKNEENSRETARDPDFDEYQDQEGKNKDEENKTKFNKKAGTYASQFTDWSMQLTRLNAIGATQFSRARQEQQRSCPGSRSDHFLLRD